MKILDFFNPVADISDIVELTTPDPITLGYEITVSNSNNLIVAKLYLDANLTPDPERTILGPGSLPIITCVGAENPDAKSGEVYDETLNQILNVIIGSSSE